MLLLPHWQLDRLHPLRKILRRTTFDEDSAHADLQRKPDCTYLSGNMELLRLRGPSPCWPRASNPTMPRPPKPTPISRGANRLLPRTRLLPTSSEDPRHANLQERYRKTCHKSASSEDSALADLQRGPDLQGVRTTHKFQSFAGKLD